MQPLRLRTRNRINKRATTVQKKKEAASAQLLAQVDAKIRSTVNREKAKNDATIKILKQEVSKLVGVQSASFRYAASTAAVADTTDGSSKYQAHVKELALEMMNNTKAQLTAANDFNRIKLANEKTHIATIAQRDLEDDLNERQRQNNLKNAENAAKVSALQQHPVALPYGAYSHDPNGMYYIPQQQQLLRPPLLSPAGSYPYPTPWVQQGEQKRSSSSSEKRKKKRTKKRKAKKHKQHSSSSQSEEEMSSSEEETKKREDKKKKKHKKEKAGKKRKHK